MKQVSYIILIWNFIVSYHNLHAKLKHPQEFLLQSLRISSQVIVSIQNSVSMKDEVTEHTALYFYYGKNDINWPMPISFISFILYSCCFSYSILLTYGSVWKGCWVIFCDFVCRYPKSQAFFANSSDNKMKWHLSMSSDFFHFVFKSPYSFSI